MKELEKLIARMCCFMHQSFFRPNYIFNNDAYFLDFCAQNFPLIFLIVNPFKHQQALHFGVLNYEKQHKEGIYRVSGRSVVFSAFYADFCLCPKLVIITTLRNNCKYFKSRVTAFKLCSPIVGLSQAFFLRTENGF